jgi:site-specific DNA-methyltransferase (adenine-specific)
MNQLYYGDNLDVLRKEIRSESVDLIYLDPPFNSRADYSILFKSPAGANSVAQVEAFEDTWHWGPKAESAFDDVMQSGLTDASELLRSLRSFLKENDMMAYLSMMCVRLIELHRVLRLTGSLYLHCDPTASHYLKLLLDAVFSPANFRNEIIWRRTGSHGARRTFGPVHDSILFYTKSDSYTFNIIKRPYMAGHVSKRYKVDDEGRSKFSSGGNVLTGKGASKGDSGVVWRGFDPGAKDRHWAVPGFLTSQMPDGFESLNTEEKLEELYNNGLIDIVEGNAWPTPVRYLSESDGQAVQDIWAAQPYTEGTVHGTDKVIDADVAWMGPTDPERLGYQTQKPVGLLKRIILASSNEGDVVLDPFCGCGTTVHAAEALKRQWIGIDITHLAISLIEKRIFEAFPNVRFSVFGTPTDIDGARELAARNKYQFQWWAVSLVKAVPFGGKKKGADSGVDGIFYFKPDLKSTEKAIISVKGGDNVGVAMIRDLGHVVEREGAKMGVFITLARPSGPMLTEATKAGFYETVYGKFPKLQILTVEELMSGQTAQLPYSDPAAFRVATRENQEPVQQRLV